MRKTERTTYELGEDELLRLLRQAATLGARQAINEHQDEMHRLNRNLELMRGFVTKNTLAQWLERSKATIDRWNIPVDCKVGNQSFYRIPDVIAYLRRIGEEGNASREASVPDESEKVAQEALSEALKALRHNSGNGHSTPNR
jgi:hypothetical protein